MSNFASPTPQLDLTMQNLANAATVIQATAYYRQVEADPKSDIPRIERWKKIGNIAVILIDNKPIIQPEQLKILTDRLARLASDGVELDEMTLKRKKTFWGKFRSLLGKESSIEIQKRTKLFDRAALDLDMRVQRESSQGLVRLAQAGADTPSSGVLVTQTGRPANLPPVSAHPPSWQQYMQEMSRPCDASTGTAAQIIPPSESCTTSALELRSGMPSTSRNPFADPLINNNKAWEGDEADEITIMLTIPDQSFQEASPST